MDQVTKFVNVTIQHQGKSVAVALLLTILFGPLGMLYSTITGGIIMLVVCLAILGLSVVTLGLASVLFVPAWIVCIVWGALAAAKSAKPAAVMLKD